VARATVTLGTALAYFGLVFGAGFARPARIAASRTAVDFGPAEGPAMDDVAQPANQASVAMETDALFTEVYDRLKAMAGKRLSQGARGTLDTTALVHDLYLRIGSQRALTFSHPNQFFTYAARAMRHLLADRARDRLRLRAGGDWMRTTLTGSDYRLAVDSAEEALALEGALQRLAETDARAAQVVELTWFAGLSQEQITETLGIARSTVARDWRFARAFLKNELGG
jgi:RNA polymerase sigma factor (TIGR02999 family)